MEQSIYRAEGPINHPTRKREDMTNGYEVTPDGEAQPMADGSADPWDGLDVQEDGHVYEGPRHFAAGGRTGRPSRPRATLRDHARGYGWKRMSWRVKALIVFLVLWAMGTINQRLDQDRTFQPAQPPRQVERDCKEDEVLDISSMTCIHIEIIEGGYYK